MHARLLARRSIRYTPAPQNQKEDTSQSGRAGRTCRCVPPPWEVEPHTPTPWSLLIKKPSKTKKPELMLVVDRYTTLNQDITIGSKSSYTIGF